MQIFINTSKRGSGRSKGFLKKEDKKKNKKKKTAHITQTNGENYLMDAIVGWKTGEAAGDKWSLNIYGNTV